MVDDLLLIYDEMMDSIFLAHRIWALLMIFLCVGAVTSVIILYLNIGKERK